MTRMNAARSPIAVRMRMPTLTSMDLGLARVEGYRDKPLA
jgi:hypothetical protein